MPIAMGIDTVALLHCFPGSAARQLRLVTGPFRTGNNKRTILSQINDTLFD